MFAKILIANRGEIAVRIARTCKRLGVTAVAVHSEADADAPHVHAADESILVGPAPVRESYLDVDSVLRAAQVSGADAIHPGYGLLSENAEFARRVGDAGLTFIGPSVEALTLFGDKIRARERARAAGVEPPPGSDAEVDPDDSAALDAEAARIGYPIMVKAASGGGGIGMQIVRGGGGLQKAVRSCADRGRGAFADARVYLERYLEQPRHIEVQVLSAGGSAITLGERECSVQRRHQKVIEESPSPAKFFASEPSRREELLRAALRIVEGTDYRGAATVEFVVDASGAFYFLEVNARLQVEHPVTEAIFGIDLVELQLRIACDELDFEAWTPPSPRGHAIEARLYAEDPARSFSPQPGQIVELSWPDMPDVRIDSGVEAGSTISPYYDPLLAKIIAHGADRDAACSRLDAALSRVVLRVQGPKGPKTTNLRFLRTVLAHADFRSGEYDTGLVGHVES